MNEIHPSNTDQGMVLQKLLEGQSTGRWKRRWVWLIILLLAVAGGILLLRLSDQKTTAPRFRTETVVTGPLVVTVSATGKLQPTNQVEVGSELSGIVEQVFVDVNGQVSKGQILARLDLSKLQDAIERSRASLVAAEAQVLQAQATVAETGAALQRFQEVARLSDGKVPSRSEMDTAEANLKRAEANEASARASVSQARANLQSDQTNLDKASIRSPIDGVVLTRQVDPGQTVAASFQAPVLFTLAEDLTKMELQVDVDEADVGQVKEGQQATFSVDAWPGRRYVARISRVGYGAQEKDGVVSYLTVLDVANDDLSLRPGMTGTAEITTLTREKTLLVPNAALRFTPQDTVETQRQPGRGVTGVLMPRPPRQRTRPLTTTTAGASRVWVLRDGEAVAVEVETGPSNGRQTEITGGALEVGMQIITESLGSSS